MTRSEPSASLFPILDPPALKGLGRMSAEAVPAGEGHLVEFRRMKVRSILNRTTSKRRLSMAYSINPYRGCEFGCRYCYARYTHEFLAPAPGNIAAIGAQEPRKTIDQPAPHTAQPNQDLQHQDLRDPHSFETKIFIKEHAAWLLEQELGHIDPADEIAIGTATDPYQPVERKERVTRSLLEVFARRSGYRLGIVTKSQLIERDIDLLREIASRNTLVIHLTITTQDAELARKLEPRAPRPDLRFRAVERLRSAGLRTGILSCPLLPGITDTEEALDGMVRRAAAVGASFFAAEPLFLKPCSRPTYLSFVREHFPTLETEYTRRFAHADFAAQPYRHQMAAMVARLCRKYGIPGRSTDALLTQNAKPIRNSSGGVLAGEQHLLFA